MKKLKLLLVMLCAMLVSIGLFACKKDDETGSSNNGGDGDQTEEPVTAESIANITKVTGANGKKLNLTFTDSDTWSGIVSSLQSDVRLTYKPTQGDLVTITGADCDFSSTIVTENDHCVVGFYELTIKPKANNPKNRVYSSSVEVTHDFRAVDDDKESCEYCHATRIKTEEDVIVHYGSFHNGTLDTVPSSVYGEDGSNGKVFYNKNAGTAKKTYIEDFGTAVVGGKTVTIPTLTVGQLEPGMTITVKGTAKATYSSWDANMGDAGYYFPVIGIADRYLNTPTWQGHTTSGYTGGTSVLVRPEGWVLYNGIGNGDVRPLGALATLPNTNEVDNGAGTGRNYGSYELNTPDPSGKEVWPESFTPGQVPSVNNWADWVVYSSGQDNHTFSDEVEVEFTWNYRQDGVIELIYNVDGSKLVCMVKVPTSSMGYYDTVLHGDYADINITSYERIETLTPNEFFATVKNDNLYYEGQEFNPATTIDARFTYEQFGNEKIPQTLTNANIYATTAVPTDTDDDGELSEAELAAFNAAATWVPMTTHRVSRSYNYYKVQINKGGETWIKYFAATELNIVANLIESASGIDIDNFKNNNTVGDFAISTDGTNVILTPTTSVYVQAIPDDDATLTNVPVTDAHRYVALSLGGTLGNITSVTSKDGATQLPFTYADGLLVLALTPDVKEVKLNGLQSTETILDLSTALGFNVSATIDKPNTPNNWYLNNNANRVTVTFTPNDGKAWGAVYVGGARFDDPDDLLSWFEDNEDFVERGIKFIYSETSFTNNVLTLTVEFPAADIANYAARVIRVAIGGAVDFEYKIDYEAQFNANGDTYDAGYYTYVAENKVYLAAAPAEGSNALTLNINAGNDKTKILNLAYTYSAENGSASFKDKTLEGAAIKVVKIGSADIVVLTIDPAQLDISTTAFGYQLKTGTSYSANYFAVYNNNAVRTTVSNAKIADVVLNEGSCLEKGLSGEYTKTKISDNDVVFIASPVEFAGAHHFSSMAAGQVCEYCGDALIRQRPANMGNIALHDNEFVELSDSYGSVGMALVNGDYPVWNGLYLRLSFDDKVYRIRNDSWIAGNAAGTIAATDSNIESTATTPIGQYDTDGNVISGKTFLEAMQGATVRVWAGYQDGTFTVVWRFYKSGDGSAMNKYDKMYWGFTHKFTDLTANELTVSFAIDGTASLGNSSNVWWVKGKIDKSMITGVTNKVEDGNLALEAGNIVDHLATVTVTGGNATDVTADVETALGLTAGEYNKYVSFDIELSGAYTTGTAYADVYTDADFTTPCEGAIATFNTAKTAITVTKLFKANEVPGVYYLNLKDDKGSTKQVDIKLDLSAVSMSNIKGTVNNTAAVVKGGTAVITYVGLDEINLANAQISVNGTKAALDTTGAEMSFTGGVKATWATGENNTGTLTLTIPPQANITGIPEYTVLLLDGEVTAVANRFTLNLLATSDAGEKLFCKEENVYGWAEGNKLYIYLFGDKSTGVEYLEFSANNADTIDTAADRILVYSLAHSVNGNNVTFAISNGLTSNITANHFESGAFKVTQLAIDLNYLAIEEDAGYYFYLNTTKADAPGYYTVAETNRTVEKATVTVLGTKTAITQPSCTAVSAKGYKIEVGEETKTTVGYFGIELVPSHTWGTNSADATLFECTVCGAILKNNSANKALIPAAQFGTGKFNVEDGFTISYFQKSANSDWDSIVARTKYGAVNIDTPNLQTNVMTSVTGDMATLKTKLANENVTPFTAGVVVEAGYAWDSIKNTTNCYVTVTIKKGVGIVYYMNGNKVLTYPADMQFGGSTGTVDDFIELFGLCAAEEGMYVATTQFAGAIDAVDALIQKGALTDAQAAERCQLYLQERDLLAELVPHSHAYTNSDHTCDCGALDPLYDYPAYNTNNTFDVGVVAMNEAKTLAWVNYIQKGEKFVFTGTHKSNSNDNWAGINVALGSYKEVNSVTCRVDRWVDGAGTFEESTQNDTSGVCPSENLTLAKSNTSFSDWTGVHATARKNGNVTITIDWTTQTQIAVTIALENGGTTTAFTYTFTATTGALRDRYNFSLGCGLSYSSLKVTEAPTRADAPTAVVATPEE